MSDLLKLGEPLFMSPCLPCGGMKSLTFPDAAAPGTTQVEPTLLPLQSGGSSAWITQGQGLSQVVGARSAFALGSLLPPAGPIHAS